MVSISYCSGCRYNIAGTTYDPSFPFQPPMFLLFTSTHEWTHLSSNTYRTIDGEQSSITLTYPQRAFFDCGEEPLDIRAWSFQEVLLSPHIISYGTQRTVFDCLHVGPLRSSNAYVPVFEDGGGLSWYPHCETRRELHKAISKTYTDSYLIRTQWVSDLDCPMNDSFRAMKDKMDRQTMGQLIEAKYSTQHADALEMWYGVLGMYTQRELSDPRDRLNGLAGVAEVYARYLKDEYVAGFWRSDLVAILTWTLAPGTRNLQRRPADYCGPTWSWASVLNGTRTYRGKPSEIWWDRNLLILDCQVTLVDDAPKFGAVLSGFLKVIGKLPHGTFTSTAPVGRDKSRYSVSPNWPTQFGHEDNPWLEKLRYQYSPDALEQEFVQDENSIRIALLVLGYQDIGGLPRECYCLVLRKVVEGVYTRLGSLEIYNGGDRESADESA